MGQELLRQAKDFKYLGVLFMSEGKMEREMDRRIGAALAARRASVVVEEAAEPEGEALDLPVQPSPMVMSSG